MTAITRFRGDTVPDKITYQINGVAVDITGFTFRLTVNTEKLPTDDSNELFSVVGVIQAPATNGIVWFTPSAGQANNLGKFYYDIEVVDGIGGVQTIAKDKYTFTQDITKVN